jgi:hypothetical protein
MTETVPLEVLRRASRMAENMFECDGEVTAFWLAETADWRGFPDKAVIRATLVTGWPGDDGLWFFQTHYD